MPLKWWWVFLTEATHWYLIWIFITYHFISLRFKTFHKIQNQKTFPGNEMEWNEMFVGMEIHCKASIGWLSQCKFYYQFLLYYTQTNNTSLTHCHCGFGNIFQFSWINMCVRACVSELSRRCITIRFMRSRNGPYENGSTFVWTLNEIQIYIESTI